MNEFDDDDLPIPAGEVDNTKALANYERSVVRYARRDVGDLIEQVQKETETMRQHFSKGIRSMVKIGKLLDGIGRAAGEGGKIAAWTSAGYDRMQANRFINRARYAHILEAYESGKGEPIGAREADRLIAAAKQGHINADSSFDDMQHANREGIDRQTYVDPPMKLPRLRQTEADEDADEDYIDDRVPFDPMPRGRITKARNLDKLSTEYIGTLRRTRDRRYIDAVEAVAKEAQRWLDGTLPAAGDDDE